MKVYNDPLDISVHQWLQLLKDPEVFRTEDIVLILTVYKQKDSKATGRQVAKLLNRVDHRGFNSQLGRLGRRIRKRLPGITFPQREDGTIRWWHIPFLGEEYRNQCFWQVRPELKEAVRLYEFEEETEQKEMFLMPEEQELDHMELYEGSKKLVAVNRYERNAKARQLCLSKYGYRCSVCDFDFEEFYGRIGKHFIEVHHLKPLSEINEEYKVNPFEDLRPVCPNCHAMLHKANVSIEELRRMISTRSLR
ncbi:HNH endonuclease [Anoxybacillus rupiensis]|jgi:5-methylcytosine-specific restriction enzyme A|uniref:HNH endonuclease n=1 Tax=Anoxybacteroides rupiense TaxID=311460 RepID=A0ABT5W9S8_9BACL|nr:MULTISPECIES: HNH endonuclease [Anoxybacillus]MDE8565569.1 HNH endonuclease [Anoxybacillus rupiensis]OQM46696.1 hypothetical protein B6A27_05970 [Anoxybacillus sp. UARK-01]QHC03347.1 HNH endonuclease [Anoxybacillus sp. PDR2]